MKPIPESELVLQQDGSVYHLKLQPGQIAETILIVGDPQRVAMISDKFDSVEHKSQNREIVTHTGRVGQKRITVMSTGMGTDNIDIVLTELDALVNIDLKTRLPKEEFRSLNIIRLGTSGALQDDIPINSVIMADYGLGLDGLVHYYGYKESGIAEKIVDAFIRQSGFPEKLPRPYVVPGSDYLAEKFTPVAGFRGITVTASGFYGPQGRSVRLPLAYPGLNDSIRNFRFGEMRVMNYEMETSALYGIGRLLNHNTLTLCLAIASRSNKKFHNDYHTAMDNMIQQVLAVVETL
ncbi:MAG: nucleoside phosphorylase [Bacteroidales bacterium]